MFSQTNFARSFAGWQASLLLILSVNQVSLPILKELISRLPDDFNHIALNDIIQVAQTISDDYWRAHNLIQLIPLLPPELKVLAIEKSLLAENKISDPQLRTELLIFLIPHLPFELLPSVTQNALQAGVSIDDDYWRARTLVDLLPHLSSDLLVRALETIIQTVQSILDQKDYLKILQDLTPYLAPEHFISLSSQERLSQAISSLVSVLPHNLLPEALKLVQSIPDEENRIEALLALSPYLEKDLMSRALQITLNVTDKGRRFHGVINLLPCLSHDLLAISLQNLLLDPPSTAEIIQVTDLVTLMPIFVEMARRNQNEVYPYINIFLHGFAGVHRYWILENLSILLPFILELSPDSKEQTATDIYHAIQEVCEWWP